MSEMIERVAEALMKERHPDAPLTYAEVVLAVSLGSDPTVLEGFRRDARAAIEAMREPTEAMVWAGVELEYAIQDGLENYVAGESVDWDEGMRMQACFTTMIDAALSVSDGSPQGQDAKQPDPSGRQRGPEGETSFPSLTLEGEGE